MPQRYTMVAIAMVVVVAIGVTHADSGIPVRWRQLAADRAWVTARQDVVRTPDGSGPQVRILVSEALKDRVVYAQRQDDLQVGGPIVSRDGTKVAFVKTERLNGDAHRRLFVIDLKRDAIQPVAKLRLGFLSGHSQLPPCKCAWSHDNTKLLTAEPMDAGASNTRHGYGLMVVDVTSGNVRDLTEGHGPVLESPPDASIITSQAWGHDNRRIVYADKVRRVTVVDTVTKEQFDLGPGTRPAWSPDGRSIVATVPTRQHEIDYVLIDAAPPHRRTMLLRGRGRYVGPAVWFPDSRYLMVSRWRGERPPVPYILDGATGAVAPMPGPYPGQSWGGTP